MGKNKIMPPKRAEKLLHHALQCGDRLHRLGDFEEVFQNIAETRSRSKAVRWYWLQVLRSVPSLRI